MRVFKNISVRFNFLNKTHELLLHNITFKPGKEAERVSRCVSQAQEQDRA